ncbi:MAG TPA: hypothetical protein PLF13_12225 [candidate division Zixibacteria bacterium]|nr:hypothetical protein [candidate division Zixibacteria bacterium]
MGGLRQIGLCAILVAGYAIIGLIVSCDQSDEVFVTAPSYQDQIDTSYWSLYEGALDTGLSVIIELEDIDYPKNPGVLGGQHCFVDVIVKGNQEVITGFSLCFTYDARIISFQEARPGELVENCDWDHFDDYYFVETDGTNIIMLEARTQTVLGFPPMKDGHSNLPIRIATLDFLVNDDPYWEGSYAPIRFYWVSCSINSLIVYANSEAAEAVIAREGTVWDYNGLKYLPLSVETLDLPSQYGLPNSCYPIDSNCFVNFVNGGVMTALDYPQLDYGDIDANGQPNELSDADLYRDYFLTGTSVFTVDPVSQERATDVNRDGITLSIEDFIYLYRLINGTVKDSSYLFNDHSSFSTFGDTLRIEKPVSGLYLKAPGDVTPTLLAPQMELRYAVINDTTNIIVYCPSSDSASGDLLYVPGGWSYLRAATPDGAQILLYNPATTVNLSATPNPFADSVVFSFRWPFIEDCFIYVYSITGKCVEGMRGESAVADQSLVWHTKNIESGIYYARLYRDDRQIDSITLLKGE